MKMKLSAVLNLMGATAVLLSVGTALAERAVQAASAIPWPLLIRLVG
jgi:hypothetical protein